MKSWVLKEGGRFVKVIELSSQAREQTLTANGLQAISAGGERLCFEHQKIKMATLRGLSCKTSNQSYFLGRSRLLNFVSFFGQQDTAITSASHPLRRFADVLWPKLFGFTRVNSLSFSKKREMFFHTRIHPNFSTPASWIGGL